MRVFVSRPVAPEALAILRAEPDLEVEAREVDTTIPRGELLEAVHAVDGFLSMLTDRVDDELLDAAPRLKVVANMAVGYDNIDVAACTRRGVIACNTPGTLAETTADLSFALLLAVARRLVEGAAYVRQGQWKTWSPSLLLGQDVHHATLGIVGMGAIGWEVARRALGFDMRVLYYSRTRRHDLEAQASIEWAEFPRLLAESDFVSIHASLTPETRHLFSTDQFRQMKRSAFLINVARGPIVDQRALYDACVSGEIGGAALDVTDPEPMPGDDPLLTLPNVIVVPHIASATRATRVKMATLAARNIIAALRGQRPPAPLNWPGQ